MATRPVTVTTSLTQVLGDNPRRRAFVVLNNGSVNVNLSPDQVAISTNGMVIAGGAALSVKGPDARLAWWAVADSGSQNARVLEAFSDVEADVLVLLTAGITGQVSIVQGGNTATVDSMGADALATTLQSLLVRAAGYGFNGATWDRLRVESATQPNLRVGLFNAGDEVAVSGGPTDAQANALNRLLVLAGLYGFNGTTWDRIRTESPSAFNLRAAIFSGADQWGMATVGADAVANSRNRGPTEASVWGYNGATWDRKRNNANPQLLASAARTATTDTADQTNYDGAGAVIQIDITAQSGTSPSLRADIQHKTGTGATYGGAISANSIAAVTGPRFYMIYPGVSGTTGQVIDIVSHPLSRIWRVEFTIGGTTPSYTFSADVSYCP